MTEEQLRLLMEGKEDEHCEFKEAKHKFSFDELCEYCVAFANEKGGKLVMGVTNNKPRLVVGSKAFPKVEEEKFKLLQALNFRVNIHELDLQEGRVLVFDTPSRPIGTPLQFKGRFWMRSGESLVPMTADQIKRINEESLGPDFSEGTIANSSIDLLDPSAVNVFRERWIKKTGNASLATVSDSQLLEDAELAVDGQLTAAALILLGTKTTLGRHLGQAEIIWEYRAAEGQIAASKRLEFRQGFLTFHDELWNLINARNVVTTVREGLFRRVIPAFNEDAVREAILNAVCHRDYRLGGSVFIRQYPKRLQLSSPGGFPDGITAENIMRKQHPRNRRLAQACEKCGLAERSGQGMDRIFDASLREGKGLPDFSGTDAYEVVLTLQGEVIDPPFVHLIELAADRNIILTTEHLVVLDEIRKGAPLSEASLRLAPHLVAIGLVEKKRRGTKNSLILSRSMYGYLGETGVYTREKGLSAERNKALLKQCIEHCGSIGASLDDFRDVLNTVEDRQIRQLVYELRDAGEISVIGRAKQARWFLAEGDV